VATPREYLIYTKYTITVRYLQGVCVMKKVGSFMVSVPGRVVSFTRLTSAERSDIYQGLWNSAKEEARHYWVRTPQHC